MKPISWMMKSLGIALFGMVTSGCYFLREGTALIGLYSSAKPVSEVLKEPELSENERTFLVRTQEVRRYAQETLGLKENKNYTTYIRTERPYLADVVSACRADSFDQHIWDYPLVGKLPYMGFFQRKDAEEEGRKLKDQGLDVMIRGVSAFSTLGWFTDPLFSFMTSYEEEDIADLLIHEMTHATVFLPGQGDFNENLALFVGNQGALDYLKARFGPASAEVQRALDGRADAETYREDLHALYLQLQEVYADPTADREQKLGRKKDVIGAFQENFRRTYEERYKTPLYKALSDRPLNNAMLMTFRNYHSNQDDFLRFFQACGEDLLVFLKEIKTLPSDEKNPLGWMEKRRQTLTREEG